VLDNEPLRNVQAIMDVIGDEEKLGGGGWMGLLGSAGPPHS
jgi:hypothetical protein